MREYLMLIHRIVWVPVLQIPKGWPDCLKRTPPKEEREYDHEWRYGWRPFRIEKVGF